MSTPEGDSIICFNGEIYNYIELRRELELGRWFAPAWIPKFSPWANVTRERSNG